MFAIDVAEWGMDDVLGKRREDRQIRIKLADSEKALRVDRGRRKRA
jgi:hypothetical protein